MIRKPKPKPRKKPTTDPGAIQLWPWPLRSYQQSAVAAFDAGKRRQMLIWHRRAGKDVFGMSLARRQSQDDIGGYWHFFPKHVQARRALWQGVDPKKGKPFIDTAFADLVHHRNNTEMFLELSNGSTWQLLGSDNYDRLVGGNARGVVFSEWALCDPRAWDYIRPIILENHGWAVFITTYRGRNHAWQMAQTLAGHPDWYVDIRTVADTTDVDGRRIITDEDIDGERSEGTSEAIIQQEYFCNPAAAVPGAVYAVQAERLRADPERTQARWNPLRPVLAAWNLDRSPTSSAVVYAQAVGERLSIIGAETFPFMPLPECIAKIAARPWRINEHLIPTKSAALASVFGDLRIFPTVVPERTPGRVEAITQGMLEMCEIHATQCGDLLDSLTGYTRHDLTHDDARPMFSEDYDETWHVQLSQAFELLAVHQYDGGTGDWSRPPTYRNADKRVI